MKPAIVTLTVFQGQTFSDTLVFEAKKGVPEDFTGYQARMQIRPRIESREVVLELTTDNGYILPLDDDGLLTFAVPAEVTAQLSCEHRYETWVYDLEIYTPDETDVQRLIQGVVVFWPETTR